MHNKIKTVEEIALAIGLSGRKSITSMLHNKQTILQLQRTSEIQRMASAPPTRDQRRPLHILKRYLFGREHVQSNAFTKPQRDR